jgi:hypothetical protein
VYSCLRINFMIRLIQLFVFDLNTAATTISAPVTFSVTASVTPNVIQNVSVTGNISNGTSSVSLSSGVAPLTSSSSSLSSSSSSTPSTIVQPLAPNHLPFKRCSIGGPPVLDIETMNRVIENALGGRILPANPLVPGPTTSTASSSASQSGSQSTGARNSSSFKFGASSSASAPSTSGSMCVDAADKDGSDSESADSEHLAEISAATLRCNEKFAEPADPESSDNERRSPVRCVSPLPDSHVINRLFADKDRARSKPNSGGSGSASDRPLNLSSTTTLKASQQVLIDNLIDKLLNNGAEGMSRFEFKRIRI